MIQNIILWFIYYQSCEIKLQLLNEK
jgi:hypothetical protein